MNKKTTLLSLKCLFVLAFSQIVSAQQIYTNGGLSTGATSASGVAAPSGYTWSEAQADVAASVANTNAGIAGYYVNSLATNFRIADDFVVPVGATWNVTSFDFYCYQTGFTGTTTPPIDVLRIQIYSGDPAAGGTIVAGDMTTNVYSAANSADALMYRVFNSAIPAPGTATGTTRRIWRVRGNITASLPAGTYWVVYQGHATNDGAFFWPTVTVPGVRTVAGWNAQQMTVGTLSWADVVDAGNPATPPSVAQDFPFLINGTVLGVDENSFEASITLSPNPVKNMLFISSPTDVNISSYEIFDVNGKVIKAVNATTSVSEINVDELAVGNYILKLKSDKGIASKKFIKE